MSRLQNLVLCLAAAGCALISQAPSRPPLTSEGELILEARPNLAGVDFEIASAAAVRSSGELVPLEAAGAVRASEGERGVAFGRLEPGSYDGVVLIVRSARVKGGDLIVSAEPLHVDASFSIAARRATVLSLKMHFPKPPRPGEPFAPAIEAIAPPRTLLQLAGYCTSSASHDVAVFDEVALRVSAAIPTGSAPWGIALDTVTNRAYVALSGEDQIAILDLASATELARIHLSAGDAPRELLLSADRRTLLSANSGSNTVSFIDPAAMIETGRVTVGDQPTSLLLDRKSARAYVFNTRGSSFSVVDPASRSVVATVPTDSAPLRGQIDKAGSRLYVASAFSSELAVFSLPSLAPMKRVYVGIGTTALKVDADTDLLYVANAAGRISIFDPFSLIPIDFIDLPGGASWLSIDAVQNVLYALLPDQRSITAIHLTTKAALGQLEAGASPRVLALYRERN
jgi:YVTN family beta-propeller protein